MIAQQNNVDVISHNLANVNTPGFKVSRTEMGDVVFGQAPAAGAASRYLQTGQQPYPPGGQGAGVTVLETRRSFQPGQLEATDRPLDLAINGPGFFEVELPDGGEAYTRAGNFQLDPDGELRTASGYRVAVSSRSSRSLAGLDPASIRVDREGRITALVDGDERELGTIQLVTFPNPAGLQAIGNGLYLATGASGEADTHDHAGEVWQGFLERSNAQVVEEMVGLIVAQRAYEMNSKVVQAADDMLGMANNLRR